MLNKSTTDSGIVLPDTYLQEEIKSNAAIVAGIAQDLGSVQRKISKLENRMSSAELARTVVDEIGELKETLDDRLTAINERLEKMELEFEERVGDVERKLGMG